MTLQPLSRSPAERAERSFMYWGDRADWLVALTQHRDSDALERSNWRVIVPDMFERFPDDVAIESTNHWAVGWLEYLLVRPNSPAAVAAQAWADKLANYPVADDDDFGMLEYSEEWCVRCDRGTREEHPLNGCQFRSEDDASEIKWRWRTRREVHV